MNQFLYLLLQADSGVAKAGASAQAVSEDPSIWQILQSGGGIMIFLGILLLAAIAFGVERFIYIQNRTKLDPNILNIVRDNLRESKLDSALNYTERTPTAEAQVVATGLRFLGQNTREIESAMETRAAVEISAMESNLHIVSLIARLAPMFGFLGTIWGVIGIFADVAKRGQVEIGPVSSQLNVKLVTSFGGLVVGIVAYTIYALFIRRIDRFSERLYEQTLSFLDLLNRSNTNI